MFSAVLAACAGRRSVRPEPLNPVGCYLVRPADSSQVGWFPDTIALLSSRSTEARIQGMYQVRLTPRVAHRMSLLSFGWTRPTGDSLEIVGSSGFSGIEFKGRLTPAGFVGSAAVFTDVATGEPAPRYALSATRAHCLGCEPVPPNTRLKLSAPSFIEAICF